MTILGAWFEYYFNHWGVVQVRFLEGIRFGENIHCKMSFSLENKNCLFPFRVSFLAKIRGNGAKIMF